MSIYIKVSRDLSATLMTESGEELWTFSSLTAAQQACGDLQHYFASDEATDEEDLSCSNCALT